MSRTLLSKGWPNIFALDVGRVSHSSIAFDVSTKRSLPVAPSASDQWRNLEGRLGLAPFENSAALEAEEMAGVVERFDKEPKTELQVSMV